MIDSEKRQELYEALQLAHWAEDWKEYNRIVTLLNGDNK